MHQLSPTPLLPLVSSQRCQRGISLIESMVAIVVMALGILGMLGMQMRTLSDTSTTVRRAQAIRFIEDLSERTKVNPNALGNIASYVIGMGALPQPRNWPDCDTAACGAQDLALSDIHQWKQGVLASLPLADAVVFQVADETVANNPRQLGVLISWRENERADGTAAENADYKAPFETKAVDMAGNAIACPDGSTCHLQYIQLTARCTPYFPDASASIMTFCSK